MLSRAVVLSVIPIVFFVTVSQFTKARGPQWMPYTFENPYNYLFASLLLAKGQSPSYIMHPGTTTQLFGAVVLRASSLKSTDDLIDYTLRNPEKQIKTLHRSLLIFTTLILWLAPWLTAVLLKNNIVGFLIQIPSLFLQTFLWWELAFGPELMLVGFSIAAVCGCVLLIAPSGSVQYLELILGVNNAFAPSGSARLLRVPVLAAVTGLICAFGLVTKIIFFPLILISLFCCRTRRNLISFVAGLLLGLAVALLPIYPQLPKLVTWIFDLGIHSGQYGSGTVGLPEPSVYLATLAQFINDEPVLAIVPTLTVIIAILLSFFSRKHQALRRISWRTILIVFGLQFFSFLVIAKHPSLHYLIPLALTMGLSLVLLYFASQTSASPISRAVGLITLLGLVVIGCKDFVEKTPASYSVLRSQTANQLRLYEHAKEITQNDVRVDYFFSDSPEVPLMDGNVLAERAFGRQLASIYPNVLTLNVFNSQFETFTDFINPEVVRQKYDHLYFLGARKWFPKVPGFDPATFETIDQAGDYYLQKWTRQ